MANKSIQVKDTENNVLIPNIIPDFIAPKTHPSTHGYDINDYKDTGCYSIGSPKMYQNIPTQIHGALIVFNCHAYKTQFYVTSVGLYYRIHAGEWCEWKLLN